jgi:molybdopterin molybdotransferase
MAHSETLCEATLASIIVSLAPIGPETIPLAEAVGRTLAADIVAPQPLPAFASAGPGAYIVHAGRPLRPEEIGLLAGLGLREARVVRRPRVAIVAVGEELLAPGAPPAAGKVYDGDSALLAASVRRDGGSPVIVGIAHAGIEALRLRLAEAIAHAADLILVTAAPGPAAHGLLRMLLRREGRLRLEGPAGGAAPLFGDLAGVPVLGLPYEPALALACAEAYVRPVVRHLAGFDGAPYVAAMGPVASPL